MKKREEGTQDGEDSVRTAHGGSGGTPLNGVQSKHGVLRELSSAGTGHMRAVPSFFRKKFNP